jgi:uncharacterized protein (DUF1330 family)
VAAYLLVSIKAHNLSWLSDYQANVPAIVHKHGGEYSVVSESIKRYEGNGPDPDGIVLFTFPSMAAIDAFISDADYEPYKAARLAGSSSDVFGFTPRG